MSNGMWQSVTKAVRGEIMKTDIFCEIHCHAAEEEEAREYLEKAFALFREFETHYSRFREGNELWDLNASEDSIPSIELFELLRKAKGYFEVTHGLFDPSILPDLEQEGYRGAYASIKASDQARLDFSSLTLNTETRVAHKPAQLKIDLGGIGKGFIVDKIARFLGSRFENFLIDAGGDIYAHGGNQILGYTSWTIDVERPAENTGSATLLALQDMAVATSGINRRHWLRNGETKHYIIDPKTRKSAIVDFFSVTVIAPDTTSADVWAKTLFIAGKKKGAALAHKQKLPAIFIDSHSVIEINRYADTYVWKK